MQVIINKTHNYLMGLLQHVISKLSCAPGATFDHGPAVPILKNHEEALWRIRLNGRSWREVCLKTYVFYEMHLITTSMINHNIVSSLWYEVCLATKVVKLCVQSKEDNPSLDLSERPSQKMTYNFLGALPTQQCHLEFNS